MGTIVEGALVLGGMLEGRLLGATLVGTLVLGELLVGGLVVGELLVGGSGTKKELIVTFVVTLEGDTVWLEEGGKVRGPLGARVGVRFGASVRVGA